MSDPKEVKKAVEKLIKEIWSVQKLLGKTIEALNNLTDKL